MNRLNTLFDHFHDTFTIYFYILYLLFVEMLWFVSIEIDFAKTYIFSTFRSFLVRHFRLIDLHLFDKYTILMYDWKNEMYTTNKTLKFWSRRKVVVLVNICCCLLFCSSYEKKKLCLFIWILYAQCIFHSFVTFELQLRAHTIIHMHTHNHVICAFVYAILEI